MQIAIQRNEVQGKTASTKGLLTAEREWELANRWRKAGDRQALGELVTAYRRLVVAAATKFKALGIPLDDLIQEGNAALVHAANRFEVERGFRFSTYASWWVRAAMIDYVLNNRSNVRRITSGAQRTLFFQVQRLRYAWQVSDRMTHEERERAAEQLGVPRQLIDDIEGFLAASDVQVVEQSELEVGSGGITLVSEQPTAEEILANHEERIQRNRWLRDALGRLNKREQTIILQRRLTEAPKTLSDLGRHFGISPERVRQIEGAALSKLRKLAAASGIEVASSSSLAGA